MTGHLYIDIETANVSGSLREVARPFMKIPAADKKLTQAEVKSVKVKFDDHSDPLPERDVSLAEEAQAIDAALQLKIHTAQDAALDQTSLNGLWGEVIAVAWAWNDGEAHSLMRVEVPDEDAFLSTLADFIESELQSSHTEKPVVIGHRVHAFDLRFLWHRHIVNHMLAPHWLLRALRANPWDTEKVYDTMIQWAGIHGYVSLEALCAGLGIEVPKTIDGSEVPQAWLDGRYDEIRAHVLADVEAVRAVHRRMMVT